MTRSSDWFAAIFAAGVLNAQSTYRYSDIMRTKPIAAIAVSLILALGATGSTAADTLPAGGADITYTLPSATKISLNIIDANGWIVRELLHADAEQSRAPHDPLGRQ